MAKSKSASTPKSPRMQVYYHYYRAGKKQGKDFIRATLSTDEGDISGAAVLALIDLSDSIFLEGNFKADLSPTRTGFCKGVAEGLHKRHKQS